MDTRKRIIIGAIGGITPYIVTLLVIDFKIALQDFSFYDGFGLFVRCLVLISLGSLVAYLHQKEKEAFKVFQLGLWAPALIATAINGYSQPNVPPRQEAKPPVQVNGALYLDNPHIHLISPAYASDSKVNPAKSDYVNETSLKEPQISGFDRFLRGLIGKTVKDDKNSWFVIVGSHLDVKDANNQVKQLEEKRYLAEVYLPYRTSRIHAVVIGTNISLSEAKKLRKQAIKDGLPKDTYLWSY